MKKTIIRILTITLIITMAFLLTACGNDSSRGSLSDTRPSNDRNTDQSGSVSTPTPTLTPDQNPTAPPDLKRVNISNADEYFIKHDNQTFTLGDPVSMFLDAGFEIKTTDLLYVDELAPNGWVSVVLTNNDIGLRDMGITILNTTGADIPTEEGIIAHISIDVYSGLNDSDTEFAGGLRLGLSKSDVITVLGEPTEERITDLFTYLEYNVAGGFGNIEVRLNNERESVDSIFISRLYSFMFS